MAMHGPAPRADLTDTQCGSVARALELQLRGRDGGSDGTIRPRHRPLRESERRDVPREHPYRRCSSHVARRTVETTPCPQQCWVDHVGDSESRDRQCQTRTSCGQLDTTTDCAQELDSFQKAAKASERTRANPRTTFRQRHALSVARLVIGRKTAGTTFPVVGRTRTSPRTRTRAMTARTTPTNNQQQSIKDKKSADTFSKRLSEEEAELVGCGKSRATVALWCDWRDDVEGFILKNL